MLTKSIPFVCFSLFLALACAALASHFSTIPLAEMSFPNRFIIGRAIVCPRGIEGPDTYERVMLGFPYRSDPTTSWFGPESATEDRFTYYVRKERTGQDYPLPALRRAEQGVICERERFDPAARDMWDDLAMLFLLIALLPLVFLRDRDTVEGVTLTVVALHESLVDDGTLDDQAARATRMAGRIISESTLDPVEKRLVRAFLTQLQQVHQLHTVLGERPFREANKERVREQYVLLNPRPEDCRHDTYNYRVHAACALYFMVTHNERLRNVFLASPLIRRAPVNP